METILWNVARSDGGEFLGAMWQPFLIGMVLYFSGYWSVWMVALARAAGLQRPFAGLSNPPDILVVIPTLLRTREDLDGLREAAETVVANRYPGRVVLSLSIDGTDGIAPLLAELDAWAGRQPSMVLVAASRRRAGKGVAVELGLERAKVAVREGELAQLPTVFFNMDADSVLGPRALERMVAKLVTPGVWTRQKPMIVASNVLVRREHYWAGWAKFFTMRYQLALQVSREYLTSISISRNNRGLLPVTGVSGALYCTWTEIHHHQARHASYMTSLRWRDLGGWWLGRALPRFDAFTGAPNVAMTAGPGDDTWLAWIAMSARWRDGRIELELARTPLHALCRLLRSFVVRPIAYDPHARVYTATPTTVRSLFNQRVRWNTSRTWLLQRFGLMPYIAWDLGAWVISDLILTLVIHAGILVALLGWPFAKQPATWLAIATLGCVGVFLIRALATLLALIQEHDVRGQWHKLLAMPLSGPFHLIFNILPTIIGFVKDFLGFGLNTKFAPEKTLAAAGRGRVALAYRVTRCAKLIVRALRYGDIPAGAFWFGFGATRWTEHGYTGWTTRRIGRGGVKPRAR